VELGGERGVGLIPDAEGEEEEDCGGYEKGVEGEKEGEEGGEEEKVDLSRDGS